MSMEERGRIKALETQVEEMGSRIGKLMLDMARLREEMKEAYSPAHTVASQPHVGAKPEPQMKGTRWR